MFKIGQREVAAVPFILIAVLSIAVGIPRENIVEYLTTIAAPMAGLAATFKFFTDTITANIAAKKYNAGEILPMIFSRDFVYAVATAAVAGLMMMGITLDNGSKQLMVDFVGNGLLFIGATLQKSFATRPPGATDTTETVVAQQVAAQSAVNIKNAQGVQAETVNAQNVS